MKRTRGLWSQPTRSRNCFSGSNRIDDFLTIDCNRKCLTYTYIGKALIFCKVEVNKVHAQSLILMDQVAHLRILAVLHNTLRIEVAKIDVTIFERKKLGVCVVEIFVVNLIEIGFAQVMIIKTLENNFGGVVICSQLVASGTDEIGTLTPVHTCSFACFVRENMTVRNTEIAYKCRERLFERKAKVRIVFDYKTFELLCLAFEHLFGTYNGIIHVGGLCTGFRLEHALKRVLHIVCREYRSIVELHSLFQRAVKSHAIAFKTRNFGEKNRLKLVFFIPAQQRLANRICNRSRKRAIGTLHIDRLFCISQTKTQNLLLGRTV